MTSETYSTTRISVQRGAIRDPEYLLEASNKIHKNIMNTVDDMESAIPLSGNR